ncbi:MAG: DUF3280 domain-containing protein [Gammaproteobacteria bacterium]|nr:DUF3280 domain-containing protein [Gammaproteobacteria bacterium]
MQMVLRILTIFLITSFLVPSAIAGAGMQRIVVLDVELIDEQKRSWHEPDRPEELARAGRMTTQIKEYLSASRLYEVVEIDQDNPELQRLNDSYQYIHTCPANCEIPLANSVSADLVMTAWVQKISNLILNQNILVKDVATGEPVMGAFIDIRGNTDSSWRNGTRYLMERFFKKYHPGTAITPVNDP